MRYLCSLAVIGYCMWPHIHFAEPSKLVLLITCNNSGVNEFYLCSRRYCRTKQHVIILTNGYDITFIGQNFLIKNRFKYLCYNISPKKWKIKLYKIMIRNGYDIIFIGKSLVN